jgi:hypothetical protein
VSVCCIAGFGNGERVDNRTMAIGQLAYGLDRRSPVSHSGVPGVFGYRGMAKRKPKPSEAGRASGRLNIRIDLASGVRIGPGKVAVSEAIARSGSISAAGRALRMSYRRAWELVEDLNTGPGTPVVEAAAVARSLPQQAGR